MKISRIIACWSLVKNSEIFLSVIIQLLSTFERNGSSNGKQTAFLCSALRLLKSVATSVSELAFLAAAFSACETAKAENGLAAATAAVPNAGDFRKGRRGNGRQKPPSPEGVGLGFLSAILDPPDLRTPRKEVC